LLSSLQEPFDIVVNEKDKVIQTQKQELDARIQEISTIKVEKAKVEELRAEPDLTVGEVDTKDNGEVATMAKNVNKLIAGKHEKK